MNIDTMIFCTKAATVVIFALNGALLLYNKEDTQACISFLLAILNGLIFFG